jgi:hypothetical protein
VLDLSANPRTNGGDNMRYFTVQALWACADVLDIVRGGFISLASKVVPR